MNKINIFFIGLLVIACTSGCLPEDEDGQGTRPALPELSITDIEVDEGSDGVHEVEVTVALSGLNLSNAVVDYRTEDGTAVAGEDFAGMVENQLLFTPADQTKTIKLTVFGDRVAEDDETLEIVLFNARNAELGQTRATVRLMNDDNTGNPYGIPEEGYTTPTEYPGRTLVWSDEFNGEQLDAASWTHEIGTGNNGWGNNELQYYRPENTFFYEGNLIIEARREDFGGRNYTSSRLITRGKREFQYGRIDIRAALPEGQGIWPALWMLGRNITQIGWPASGEIDIMELIGSDPGRVHGTVHYGQSTAQHQFRGQSTALSGGETFAEEFHVFSLVWEQDRLQWLLDDEPFFEITRSQLGSAPWPFNQPFFFIFNVAVGGNWPGSPDETTIFPQRLIVDYVRVFQ